MWIISYFIDWFKASNDYFWTATSDVTPVTAAARSKAWVCGRSPAKIVGSNLTGGMDVCLL